MKLGKILEHERMQHVELIGGDLGARRPTGSRDEAEILSSCGAPASRSSWMVLAVCRYPGNWIPYCTW
jgi:hypothetical protein